jgi:hypothetical protein
MPLKVKGELVHTSEELFNKCLDGEAHQFSLGLQKIRYSYHEIPKKTVGTIDATSCIGIIYRANDGTTYVQHYDGRPMHSIQKYINAGKSKGAFQVIMIGGCRIFNNNDYSSLEKHTAENIEKLVHFWKKSNDEIDIQGWVIGDARSYETLFSDFVVNSKEIYLLKQGEVGKLHFDMDGALIPYLSRRLATILSNQNFFLINPSERELRLHATRSIHFLRQWAEQVQMLDDLSILKNYSTTPGIEPPYYSRMLREMALYVISHQEQNAKKIPLQEENSIFCIQGEIVKIKR